MHCPWAKIATPEPKNLREIMFEEAAKKKKLESLPWLEIQTSKKPAEIPKRPKHKKLKKCEPKKAQKKKKSTVKKQNKLQREKEVKNNKSDRNIEHIIKNHGSKQKKKIVYLSQTQKDALIACSLQMQFDEENKSYNKKLEYAENRLNGMSKISISFKKLVKPVLAIKDVPNIFQQNKNLKSSELQQKWKTIVEGNEKFFSQIHDMLCGNCNDDNKLLSLYKILSFPFEVDTKTDNVWVARAVYNNILKDQFKLKPTKKVRTVFPKLVFPRKSRKLRLKCRKFKYMYYR